jgi:hypothetical protein
MLLVSVSFTPPSPSLSLYSPQNPEYPYKKKKHEDVKEREPQSLAQSYTLQVLLQQKKKRSENDSALLPQHLVAHAFGHITTTPFCFFFFFFFQPVEYNPSWSTTTSYNTNLPLVSFLYFPFFFSPLVKRISIPEIFFQNNLFENTFSSFQLKGEFSTITNMQLCYKFKKNKENERKEKRKEKKRKEKKKEKKRKRKKGMMNIFTLQSLEIVLINV